MERLGGGKGVRWQGAEARAVLCYIPEQFIYDVAQTIGFGVLDF